MSKEPKGQLGFQKCPKCGYEFNPPMGRVCVKCKAPLPLPFVEE